MARLFISSLLWSSSCCLRFLAEGRHIQERLSLLGWILSLARFLEIYFTVKLTTEVGNLFSLGCFVNASGHLPILHPGIFPHGCELNNQEIDFCESLPGNYEPTNSRLETMNIRPQNSDQVNYFQCKRGSILLQITYWHLSKMQLSWFFLTDKWTKPTLRSTLDSPNSFSRKTPHTGRNAKNKIIFLSAYFARGFSLLGCFASEMRQSFLPYVFHGLERQGRHRSTGFRAAIWLARSVWLGYKRDLCRLRRETLRGFWQHLCRKEATWTQNRNHSSFCSISLLSANITPFNKMCKGLAGLPASCLKRWDFPATNHVKVLERLSQFLACCTYHAGSLELNSVIRRAVVSYLSSQKSYCDLESNVPQILVPMCFYGSRF